MTKKTFFKDTTKAKIKKKTLVEVGDLPEIDTLQFNEYVIVNSIVPRGYGSPKKFLKHGEEVKIKRYRRMGDAIRDGKTPVQLREDAFDAIQGREFCGYSIMPLGRDRRKRKTSLVTCMEGARIFSYANQVRGTGIKTKAYADAQRVRFEGAEALVEVPSRQVGERRYQFKLMSVPMKDDPQKYAIVSNLGSDHVCGHNRFKIRYRFMNDKECSGITNVCPHEVAGYLQLVQREWEDNKNVIPLQMSPYAIPSQKTVDYYLKWENNVLVRDLNTQEGLRKPNIAEKEIGLWAYVNINGHDKTFYSTSTKDGRLADYNWGK